MTDRELVPDAVSNRGGLKVSKSPWGPKDQIGRLNWITRDTTRAILEHLDVEFSSFDVLQDPDVRTGIKEFSDWPTIPQLYVKGEFVGGSDIMMEMFEAGELAQLVADKGVATASG